MEPVCPVDDYLTTRGTVQPDVTLRPYVVIQDDANGNPWPTTINVRGSHGVERTTGGGVQGDIVTTATTWYITSKTPAEPILARPPLNSKITACGKVWLILDIGPSPRNGRLFRCECQMSVGG